MAQKLTDRAALDPLLANGWALVDGRDALEKNLHLRQFHRRLQLDDPRGHRGPRR